MCSTLSQKSQKNSFFLVPQESLKSRVLQVRAYKYLRTLDIDAQFIETTKSKRIYIKTFSYAKAQIPRKFEQNYTLTLFKKQKRLTRVMDTYGHAVPVFSKVLKRRNVKKVTCPYIQTEDKFLKILQNSSSFRKNLTHVGIVLKAERQSDVSSRILFQLHRCTKLASLSVFCFGSTNPLTEKALAQEISIKTLRNFHVIFVWMSRSLLINTTQMLKANSHLTDLSINVVEWKVKGNDQEFKSFLDAIQNLQNLRQLKLSNVALDSEHTNILLDSISQLKNLRCLGIGLGLFSHEQYPSLKLICVQLQNLVDLSLEFNSTVLRAEFFAYLVLLQNLKKLHVKINFEEGLRPCLDDLKEFFVTHPLLEGFSFEAFQTPNLEEESFNELIGYLRLCPKLTFLDLRVRRFAGRYPEVQAFNNLSESLGYLTNLQELSLNFHLWYPTRCDLSKLAQSLANLPRLKNLTVHFPMIEERSTQTLMIFCQNIVNLKELRLLKLEFCIDDQIDIETQLFGYLLQRLPKLKELSIWYHDLTRSNSEVVTPFAHLEKIAIEKYQLTSFILANVLVYTYKLNAEGKEVR